MASSLLRNKLVLAILVVVVLGGAWYGLSSSGSSGPPAALTSSGSDTSGDSSIVSSLLALQAITLSGTILSNPAFVSLKDFTTAIVPEPTGRSDPFAPISAQSAATSSQTSVQIFKPAQ